ncbi:MAG: flagellar biosynthesis protein FliO [Xanthobacteraceae bacterium]|nr:MAG: flagellar biosynthesis protein FliO [Xanthobacteraceae bacterium]
MSTELKFFLAFVVVLALIGGAAWLVRRFGSGTLGTAANRGRLPRLAVIDAAPVDNRRRLVLVRRDNVEHLIMIGGPSDVVIEANIARAQMPRAPADAAGRLGPAEAPAWSEPELGNGRPEPQEINEPQFRPEPPPRPLRPAPLPDEPRRARVERPLRPEPQPRLDAMRADPMRMDPMPLRPEPPRAEPMRAEPRLDPIRPEAGSDEPPAAPMPDSSPRSPRVEPARPMMTRPTEPKAASPRPAPSLSEADQNLAEMAQRLEAALRRPAEPRSSAPAAGSGATPAAPDPAAQPGPRKPAAPAKSEFDSLEDEMASLLGRPKNPS